MSPAWALCIARRGANRCYATSASSNSRPSATPGRHERAALDHAGADPVPAAAPMGRWQLAGGTLERRDRVPAALGARTFNEARRWIRALEEGARPALGYGYDIVWRDINHRQLGRNRLPEKIVLPSAEDALRLLGRLADARRFDALAAATLAAFPSLRDWLGRRQLTLLEQAAAWPRTLSIM